jgi:hypothetical protein
MKHIRKFNENESLFNSNEYVVSYLKDTLNEIDDISNKVQSFASEIMVKYEDIEKGFESSSLVDEETYMRIVEELSESTGGLDDAWRRLDDASNLILTLIEKLENKKSEK